MAARLAARSVLTVFGSTW